MRKFVLVPCLLAFYAITSHMICPLAIAGRAKEKSKAEVKKGELNAKFKEIAYEMKAGTIYQIDLESKKFDTILFIKNPAGKAVAFDDDGGEGLNSRLLFVAPEAGTFKLGVTSYQGKGAGPFTLTIRKKQPSFQVSGQLTEKDPLDKVREKSHQKVHKFKMKAGKRYVIYLLSKDFDAYLRVEDPNGKTIKENDDIARRDLNSRIYLHPKKDGMYKLIVTTARGGETGKYLLSLLEPTLDELKAIDPVAALLDEPAPNLNGTFSFNGKTKKLSDLKGKVVLLDFWAVWCGPCIKSFPHLRHLSETYKKDGLEVLGVTTYFNYHWDKNAGRASRANKIISQKEENVMLEQFAKEHKLPYRVMAISKQGWQQASKDYGVRGIPTAVVIDRAGNVRMVRVGASEANAKALEDEIKRLLKKK